MLKKSKEYTTKMRDARDRFGFTESAILSFIQQRDLIVEDKNYYTEIEATSEYRHIIKTFGSIRTWAYEVLSDSPLVEDYELMDAARDMHNCLACVSWNEGKDCSVIRTSYGETKNSFLPAKAYPQLPFPVSPYETVFMNEGYIKKVNGNYYLTEKGKHQQERWRKKYGVDTTTKTEKKQKTKPVTAIKSIDIFGEDND